MLEFTGDYYRCLKCNHIWDYSDFGCPNCECKYEIEDINPYEIKQRARYSSCSIVESKRLIDMLKLHDDLRDDIVIKKPEETRRKQ